MQEIIQQLNDQNNPLTQEFILFTRPWNVFSELTIWLRILRDHMGFIRDRSAPAEKELINNVTQLYDQGEQLRMTALAAALGQTNLNPGDFLDQVIRYIRSVKLTKQFILNQLLNGQIRLGLPPTFISHMLNELQDAQLITSAVRTTGQLPPPVLMNHHELWVSDMVGHLDGIKCDLDGMEKILRKRVKKQKKAFEKIHMKILEFINYIKHGMPDFPALQRLTSTSEMETLLYLRLLKEINDMVVNKVAIGRLQSDMLIHMILEEVYYLFKLKSAQPGFDPLKQYPIVVPQTIQLISQMK